MNLKAPFEDQMASSSSSSFCFLRNPLPWIAASFILLIISGFLGFGFLPILFTSLVLIVSTCYFTFSKQKPLPLEKIGGDKNPIPKFGHITKPQLGEVVSKLQPENETIPEKKEAQEKSMEESESEIITVQKKEDQEDCMNQIQNYLIKSSDSLSESESVDDQSTTSDQDSEVDWPFQDNVNQGGSACSDGSISDEESLIEIALPSGHYVSSNNEKEQPKLINLQLQKKLPDFSVQSIFQQHSLMELFAEINNDMNEEDNLIEIDISIGSIKDSRFVIEA